MFFVQYDFMKPSEEPNLRESVRVLDEYDLLAALEGDGSGVQVFTLGGDDDVIVGSEGAEAIDGGAGADIIIGDGMNIADLYAAGYLTEPEVRALSLAVAPSGDLEALAQPVDPTGDLG